MGGFLKSARFRVILCVLALLVGVMIYAVSEGGYTISTVGIFSGIAAPFQKAANDIGSGMSHFVTTIRDADDYYRQNQQLRQEINELSSQLAEFEQTKERLAELEAFVGIKEKHEDYTITAPCEVIGYIANDPYKAFMINGGTEDGISLYDPVVTELGLVGIVTQLGQHTATVTTILSPDVSVAACSTSSRDRGVLTGTVALAQDGMCLLQYLDRDTLLKRDKAILTTGENGRFPRGYVLGYVRNIGIDSSGLTAYAEVEPAADLGNLDMVVVVTDFDGKGELDNAQ